MRHHVNTGQRIEDITAISNIDRVTVPECIVITIVDMSGSCNEDWRKVTWILVLGLLFSK